MAQLTIPVPFAVDPPNESVAQVEHRTERHYCIGPVSITLCSDVPGVIEDYDRIYHSYATAAPDVGGFCVEVIARRSWRSGRLHYHICSSCEERFTVRRKEQVLPHVETAINLSIARFLPHYLQIHAAALTKNGAGLICPGKPGVGKSTLAAALLARGWSYASDEFALLDPRDGLLIPYPKALNIKSGSVGVLRALGLPVGDGPAFERSSKGRIWPLNPLEVRRNAIAEPCPVRFVIFPEYGLGRPPAIEPISRARAVFELSRCSFNFLKFRSRAIELLIELTADAECYRLRTGNLDETCELIEGLVGRVSPFVRRKPAHLIRAATVRERSRRDGVGAQPCEGTAPLRSRLCSDRLCSGGLVGPSETHDLLARLLGASPDLVAAEIYRNGLWEYVATEAWQSRVGGMLLSQLRQTGIEIPEFAATQLDAYREHVRAANAHRLACVSPLLSALNRSGVPYLVLKGAALCATLYDDAGQRPMVDVDLLIRPGDAERVDRVLRRCGCTAGRDLVREDFFPRYHYEREYFTLDRPAVKIDLHVRPFRPLRYARTMPEDAFWDRPRTTHIGDIAVAMPSAENMLIHLAVHAACHGLRELRWLYDVKRWLERFGPLIDRREVVAKCTRWKLGLPMRRALEAVSRAFERQDGAAVDIVRELSRGTSPLDALALWQAPHGESRPACDVAVNFLCTPGLRFRLGYLRAVLFPGSSHLGEIYGRRHTGWQAAAHALRLARCLARPFKMVEQPAE